MRLLLSQLWRLFWTEVIELHDLENFDFDSTAERSSLQNLALGIREIATLNAPKIQKISRNRGSGR